MKHAKRILLIQGHPDRAPHFGHALAEAYAAGAARAGHAVSTVCIADLDFPVLRSKDDWEHGEVPPALLPVQQAMRAADHVVLFFPLWLGEMPALLKAFLEQLLRPGFAIETGGRTGWQKRLGGRSARIVVTMGMPAPVYRWFFRAHGVKSLERNVLAFVGFSPVSESLIGSVEGTAKHRNQWLSRMSDLGSKAS